MEKEEDETIIEPPRNLSFNFRELWQYRELFYFFTWRDVKVKYKQTVLGIVWVVLQPVLTVLIFSVLFERTLKDLPAAIPYPVFVFSGLLLWNIFSVSISNAGNSMVSNAQIIKKIYFPRLIIPVSAILVSLIDFVFSFLVFIVFIIFYSVQVNILLAIFLWPVAILLAVVGTLGPSCWLAALNVKYRDFRYVIPFLLQVLLFVTPIIYPVSIITYPWLGYVIALNPMYGAIALFRLPLMPGAFDGNLVQISICSSFLLVLIGIFYFRKTESFFADLA